MLLSRHDQALHGVFILESGLRSEEGEYAPIMKGEPAKQKLTTNQEMTERGARDTVGYEEFSSGQSQASLHTSN